MFPFQPAYLARVNVDSTGATASISASRGHPAFCKNPRRTCNKDERPAPADMPAAERRLTLPYFGSSRFDRSAHPHSSCDARRDTMSRIEHCRVKFAKHITCCRGPPQTSYPRMRTNPSPAQTRKKSVRVGKRSIRVCRCTPVHHHGLECDVFFV